MDHASIEAFTRKNRSGSLPVLAAPHGSLFWNLRADFGRFSRYENSLLLPSHRAAIKTSGNGIAPAIHRGSLA
jgi:hypothetical protein